MSRFAYSSIEHFCVVLNTIGRQIMGMVVAIPVVSAATRGRRSSPSLTQVNGKTSTGPFFGTQSRGCAGQTVRPSPHSISQTSVGKLLKGSIFGLSILPNHRGLGEAISSEPPSLACPIQEDWRARVAEREGVHLLGEPERADLMRH